MLLKAPKGLFLKAQISSYKLLKAIERVGWWSSVVLVPTVNAPKASQMLIKAPRGSLKAHEGVERLIKAHESS